MASILTLVAVTMTLGCSQTTTAQSGHSHTTKTRKTGEQESNIQAHADKLYAAVKQSRKELREMRIAAGLHAHASGSHIDPEDHHANDSPEQRRRERNEKEGHEDGKGHEEGGDRGHTEGREHGHREGRESGHSESGDGEHRNREGREDGHREREHSERGHGEHRAKAGGRIEKLAKHVLTYKNGAKLTLQYNSATQAFIGKVTNTTQKPLEDVRVEIHLSNGTELGPTKRTNVAPGKTIPVELGAFGEDFTHWTTHPEAGNEEAHGEGDEERERAGGEHRGERGGHSERERGEHSQERGHSERERGEHSRRGDEHREGREKGGEHGSSHSHSGEGHSPGDASLRPVYNQLQLLRGEMAAFAKDLKVKRK